MEPSIHGRVNEIDDYAELRIEVTNTQSLSFFSLARPIALKSSPNFLQELDPPCRAQWTSRAVLVLVFGLGEHAMFLSISPCLLFAE